MLTSPTAADMIQGNESGKKRGLISSLDFMNFYLLSRNLRPSQLLGGDLCRTEFMVHLFGTIYACSPSPLEESPSTPLLSSPSHTNTSSLRSGLVGGGQVFLRLINPAMFN